MSPEGGTFRSDAVKTISDMARTLHHRKVMVDLSEDGEDK